MIDVGGDCTASAPTLTRCSGMAELRGGANQRPDGVAKDRPRVRDGRGGWGDSTITLALFLARWARNKMARLYQLRTRPSHMLGHPYRNRYSLKVDWPWRQHKRLKTRSGTGVFRHSLVLRPQGWEQNGEVKANFERGSSHTLGD